MAGELHAGFTGSRYGVTPQQLDALILIMQHVRPDVLHVGMCTGADMIAAEVSRTLDHPPWLVGHPGPASPWRADFPVDELRDVKDYLPRNNDIVAESTTLIATPRTMTPGSGGTWYTIRHALAQLRYIPLYIAWPSGTITWPNGGRITLSDLGNGRFVSGAQVRPGTSG